MIGDVLVDDGGGEVFLCGLFEPLIRLFASETKGVVSDDEYL